MTRRVTDGNGTHHLSVAQRIDLSSVAWDARADQCIRRKRHRLHLSISAHMKGVRSEETKRKENEIKADSRDWMSTCLEWQKKTYGFPPGIPDRLGGRPGTRMWWWGSNPTYIISEELSRIIQQLPYFTGPARFWTIMFGWGFRLPLVCVRRLPRRRQPPRSSAGRCCAGRRTLLQPRPARRSYPGGEPFQRDPGTSRALREACEDQELKDQNQHMWNLNLGTL